MFGTLLMKTLPDPYRRWLFNAMLAFVWCGIVPLFLPAGYYAFKKPTDFDPALLQLRGKGLKWAVRIGSYSSHRGLIGVTTTRFGYTVSDDQVESRHSRMFAGKELEGAYRATYIAKFEGSALPIIATAYRDEVLDDGAYYSAEVYGFRPIRLHFLFISCFSIAAVVLLELHRFSQNRKQKKLSMVSGTETTSNL